jgi:elongator complex protein 6
LETGAAKDVSGVLRWSLGGDGGGEEKKEGMREMREMEVLYLVQRDGGVRVFGRGEGGD